MIDKETGQPIAGAVLTMRVYTTTPTAGGPFASFAYAAETITNEDGEFSVPAHRLKKLSPWTRWHNEDILIFKPGYACYPGKDSEPDLFPSRTLPANQFVTIKLPKLKNLEERKKNLPCLDRAEDHLYIFSRYYDEQRMELGYEACKLENYYRHKGLIGLKQKTILDYPKPEKKITAKFISRYPPPLLGSNGVIFEQSEKSQQRNYGGRQIVIPPSPPADKVYLVKYQNDEMQAELIDKLQREEREFQLEDGSVVIPEKDRPAIDRIIEGIDNKSHMLFLDKEKKDIFVNLLRANNIPYILRTVPDVIGYDVIWDYADNDKAELLKLQFFKKILLMN
ncbi:MAG: hypothetical protein KKA54_11945 [Proteobacteria bacterium]|nr:hypothetical protein [Pseudomonadota bacterium]